MSSTWWCRVCAPKSIPTTSVWRPCVASVMYFVRMFDRLRQSLALRLAWQYALMFAVCAAMLFGVLYWLLARSLERRDQEAVEHRADDFAASYDIGGPAG